MASCYTAGLQCHTGHYGFGSTIASRWLAPPCSLKWICGSARVARWQSVSSLGWPVYLWRALLSRQCIKCLVKPVCAPLLLKLLLVCQPAAEKSAVITYKVLKWKILQTLFLLFILYLKKKSFPWFFCSLLFSCLPCSTHRWTNQHLPDTQVIQLCSAGILEDCTEAYICPLTVRTESCTQIDTFAGLWITQRQLYMGGRIRCDSSWADCQKNSWFSVKPKQQRWCCIETPVTPESPWLA